MGKIKINYWMIIALLILIASLFFVIKNNPDLQEVCIEDKICFGAEIAESQEELILGLSYRKKIPENRGMLFILPEESVPGFWMKDMRFSLDIIWVDKNLEIVGIEKDLQPCEPARGCISVYPDEKIIYVLEINSGLSDLYSLEEGDRIYLKQ